MVLNLSTESDTEYLTARTPHDYRLCHALLKKDSIDFDRLSFPTVLAKRYREAIGLISTQPREDLVAVGPVHVSVEGNPVFVFINLVKLYEALLSEAGVTSYFFIASDDRLINNIKHIGGDWKHEIISTEPLWIRRDLR